MKKYEVYYIIIMSKSVEKRKIFAVTVILRQGVNEMGDNLKLGFIILLTGIVIVFAVLILLICIIFVYGDIVSSIQNSIEKKKKEKEKEKEQAEKENEPVVQIAAEEPKEKAEASEVDEEEISLDVVAAIAAAVDYIFGQGSVKIKSVKRSSKRRSAWKSAGVAENTRSFY